MGAWEGESRSGCWEEGYLLLGGEAGSPQEAAINTSVSAQSSWKMFVLVTDYK